jgi:DNA mismatch endonuclease, patch repair protein
MEMTDTQKISARMSRVRTRDTPPEMAVRRCAHRLGYRFRLHARDLPGKPDLVFPSQRRVIFVNGCFWHRHRGCRRASMPVSNVSFWEKRFATNVARDQRVQAELAERGWSVLVIWECQTRAADQLITIIDGFLSP